MWFQGHDTSVESVGPANIRRGRQRRVNVEKLVRRSKCDNISIQKDDSAKLGQAPNVDLGECIKQVAAIEEVKVGGIRI